MMDIFTWVCLVALASLACNFICGILLKNAYTAETYWRKAYQDLYDKIPLYGDSSNCCYDDDYDSEGV